MHFKPAAAGLLTAALVFSPSLVFAQGPPPPPPGYAGQGPGYGPGGWETPPSEYQEVGRKGYHDGVEGARKDYENHRRPDVNNRDEYRHPSVSDRDRRVYRDAFQRGYQAGVEHLMNGQGHPY